jgi:uncharacterized membrane protein
MLALCGAFGCINSEQRGEATGSSCDSDLSYAQDVAPIMQRYCVSCHDSNLPLTARRGAPGDHNFDTEEGVLDKAEAVQIRAGIGPGAENRSMPPEGFAGPSDEERGLLARFLACHIEIDDSPAAHHH